MNRLMESCIALMTKLLPFGMPTAKLYGWRCAKNLSRNVQATWLAMSFLMAVGVPREQSLEESLESLWRQNK